MVSVETVLLRGKRRMEGLLEVPALRVFGSGAAYFGSGFLLSGVRLWGQMQPVAIGLTAASHGWRAWCGAAGSALGYRVLWGQEGLQGVVWILGMLVLTEILHLMREENRLCLPTAAACLISGTGLAFQLRAAEAEPLVFALRILVAGGTAALAQRVAEGERTAQYLAGGLGVMGLSGLHPLLGRTAAGWLALAAPLPAAVVGGLAADLSGGGVPMAGVVGLAFLGHSRFRGLAPGAACLLLMAALRVWEPGTLAAVALGGLLGQALPLPRAKPRAGVSAAQVRLEQAASVFSGFQRQLLEAPPACRDDEATLEQLKQKSCAVCSARAGCLEAVGLNTAVLAGGQEFLCRRPSLMQPELRRSREDLRRLRALHARQGEYRTALAQQYGFLADALHTLSDQLPGRESGRPRFRVLVSSRSRGRGIADGDRVSAFPGLRCRYYIILCDGMGTGLGAAEESRTASERIRQMLTAGLSPESVLGSINSQLALMDRAGAVTVDLAEIRLDSGRALLYKWGAAPCWLLRHGHLRKVGNPTPPPGLGVSAGKESICRTSLAGGETLLMVSDGICPETIPACTIPPDLPPGDLAAKLLLSCANQDDDATAVVIRLERKSN